MQRLTLERGRLRVEVRGDVGILFPVYVDSKLMFFHFFHVYRNEDVIRDYSNVSVP